MLPKGKATTLIHPHSTLFYLPSTDGQQPQLFVGAEHLLEVVVLAQVEPVLVCADATENWRAKGLWNRIVKSSEYNVL